MDERGQWEEITVLETEEDTMKRASFWKKLVVVCEGALFVLGGACLPDNTLAGAAGEIVNGLIIAGFNMLAGGSGLQV